MKDENFFFGFSSSSFLSRKAATYRARIRFALRRMKIFSIHPSAFILHPLEEGEFDDNQ